MEIEYFQQLLVDSEEFLLSSLQLSSSQQIGYLLKTNTKVFKFR